MNNYKYGFNDKPKFLTAIPLSAQHVFSVFSGTMSGAMLVAAGFSLSLNDTAFLIQCAMFIAAVTTVIQSIGIGPFGARLPIVSCGSYTFIGALVALGTNENIGIAGAFGAAFAGSVILTICGPFAVKYLHRYFTPVVTGSVVLAVGFCLMGAAFGYAVDFNPKSPDVYMNFGVAMFTLVVAILLSQFAKGFLKVTSLLFAILIGYAVSIALGMVDFSSISQASIVSFPQPMKWGMTFNIGAIITIACVHIATIMELIGDTTGVTSGVENRLPTRKELTGAVLGDGIGSCIAALFNGLPVISGGANVGIVCMTGVASRYITALGGIMLGLLAFFPKVAQILALIPNPVMGGVLIVIFGSISANGIRVICMDKITPRNVTILSISLAFGMGGYFNQEALSFLPPILVTIITGISGTALLALLLNMVLPHEKENELEENCSN